VSDETVEQETRKLESLGVAEAKRRFAELIDRVQRGERFVVSRRGHPVVALVPPGNELRSPMRAPPAGLAAVAGALADWEELDDVVSEIYAARRRARDRPPPELA
jgi:prevent-host-death family protein